jgi:hypothetical protein
MRAHIIPYYVRGVQAGLTALSLAKRHHPLDGVEIMVDGVADPVDRTVIAAYTQTISSMAAIYSRLLLEFLGLKVAGTPSRLVSIIDRTHQGDIGIEKFQKTDGSPLAKVSPDVFYSFDDPQEVERAWITTCDFAGQRLAHMTNDFRLNGSDVTPMLARTFETIPKVMTRVFFDQFDSI